MRQLKPIETKFTYNDTEYMLSVTKYNYKFYRWDASVWSGDLVMAELGIKPGSWVTCSTTPDLIKATLKAVKGAYQRASYRAKVKPRKVAFSNLIAELGFNSWQNLDIECNLFKVKSNV